MSERRPTYRIPAREVVPGMMYVLQNRLGQTSQITEVERRNGAWERCWSAGDEVILWRGQAGRGFLRHELVDIQLPGPSPRELACTCEAWEPELGPASHADNCPVAPVPGRHGGMRIWPAPFKGAPWTWNRHSRVLIVPHGPAVSAHCLLDDLPAGLVAPCTADLLWHCFYLPPEPQEERREPTPWAPHAGYDDLAVRYG